MVATLTRAQNVPSVRVSSFLPVSETTGPAPEIHITPAPAEAPRPRRSFHDALLKSLSAMAA
jgi:hypothetical protein